MASRGATRALRSSLKQFAAPIVQRHTFTAAVNAARIGAVAAPRTVTVPFQQRRGVKTIDFAGTRETVYGENELILILSSLLIVLLERGDWPGEKLLVSHKTASSHTSSARLYSFSELLQE